MPDRGSDPTWPGIAPVLVISIMTRRSKPSIIVLLLHSNSIHQTILLHSGFSTMCTNVKAVLVLAESMTISDPGLFNTPNAYFTPVGSFIF